MDGSKWTVQKGESGRSRTIVDGLLSQSGRSWVNEDGHSTKNERSFGIIRSRRSESVNLNGLKVLKWKVQKFTLNTHYP